MLPALDSIPTAPAPMGHWIWQGMSGNGWQIGSASITTIIRLLPILPVRTQANTVSGGAVPGRIRLQSGSKHTAGPGIYLLTTAPGWGSAVPGMRRHNRLIHEFTNRR